MTRLLPFLIVGSLSQAALAQGDTSHAGHGHSETPFFEHSGHTHASARNTPIVHSFGIEPAYTGRDLIVDYGYAKSSEGREQEIEVEIEWALTERFGLIVEVPYIFEEGDEGTVDGFGDLAIVPRWLLHSSDRFAITAQVEVALPTGSEEFQGDWAVAPGFSIWGDLGNWWTLNAQVAVERDFDEDSDAFSIGVGLIKSIPTQSGGAHPGVGLLNFHLELTADVPLDGDESGEADVEGLFGISYGLSEAVDIRAAYSFPVSDDSELDYGLTGGVIVHF